MIKNILENLGYVKHSGKINWEEIVFDIGVTIFLFALFVAISAVS